MSTPRKLKKGEKWIKTIKEQKSVRWTDVLKKRNELYFLEPRSIVMRKVVCGMLFALSISLVAEASFADTNFDFLFTCNSGSTYYTGVENVLLSSQVSWDVANDGNLYCDSVCVRIADADNNGINEVDGLATSDFDIYRYSGDLGETDGDFTVLSHYGVPNTLAWATEDGTYFATACWTTKWTDGYAFVYHNGDAIRKTVVKYTDENDVLHTLTAIPMLDWSTM